MTGVQTCALPISAGTPRAIVQKINTEFAAAARQSDVMARLEAQGTFVVAASPEAFRQKVTGEATRWTKIIREKNIKAEE